MKNTWKWISLLAVALCGCAIRPPAARAQFIGFTAPQTTTQTAFNAVSTTGTQVLVNLGQTTHFLTYTTTSAAQVVIRLEGSIDGTNYFPISDNATNSTQGVAIAVGYYPLVRANLVVYNGSGTLTAFYSGGSATPGNAFGNYVTAQRAQKVAILNHSSDSIASEVIPTPFGSSAGTLVVIAPASLSATAIFTINTNIANESATTTTAFTLGEAVNFFTFTMPANPAETITVSYSPGTAATTTFSAYYLFSPPGLANQTLAYETHITATTATSVTDKSGTLYSLAVNTPAAGTVSIFDLKSASCTGTPVTNTVAVLTEVANISPHLIPYNLLIKNGICVKASATMDITVMAQ